MITGIDASRAFIKERTGIEEYSYQVIKNLTHELKNDQVVLYIRHGQKVDLNLPANWKIKIICWPFLWTQAGLSLEMFFYPPDVLFIPAHIVPVIHPQNTLVTVHGLEYELCPEAYSFWERLYMRWSIKLSCRRAKKIIAVSENTKKDLIRLYKVPEEKVAVVYEGVGDKITCLPDRQANYKKQNTNNLQWTEDKPYLLFIGRLEARKNIIGIIESFEILKEKYKIPHQLILAGKPGFGFSKIEHKIQNIRHKSDIVLTGFVSEKKKIELLKKADIFLFPTFYEGFGLPILEAQSIGVPVVASHNSSIPEITGNSALLVNPEDPEEIAAAVHKLIFDAAFRDDIIEKGAENAKKFSWEKCGREIAKILTSH